MGFPGVLRELDPNCTTGPEVRASKRPRISTSDLAKVGQGAGLVTSLWQTDSAGWGRRLSGRACIFPLLLVRGVRGFVHRVASSVRQCRDGAESVLGHMLAEAMLA